MPTPPLKILHALLSALSLDLPVPSLSSIPPSLFLLLLETLLERRLDLSPNLRAPISPDDDVELAKCILGVLTPELGMDLSLVDPARVAAGSAVEIGVVVMALAVLARRRGVDLELDPDNYDSGHEESVYDSVYSHSRSLLDDDDDDIPVPPLIPLSMDMYTTPPRIGLYDFGLEAEESGEKEKVSAEPQLDTTPAHKATDYYHREDERKQYYQDLDPLYDRSYDQDYTPDDSQVFTQEDTQDDSHDNGHDSSREHQDEHSYASYASDRSGRSHSQTRRSRTVLHQLLEEFGLDASPS